MLRGFDPPREIAVHDLRDLLAHAVAGHTVRPCSDEDILASADDDAAFGRLLLARIGMPPLLSEVAVDLDIGTEPLPVLADRDRVLDLVTYLLEDLVGTGARAIAIHAGRDGDSSRRYRLRNVLRRALRRREAPQVPLRALRTGRRHARLRGSDGFPVVHDQVRIRSMIRRAVLSRPVGSGVDPASEGARSPCTTGTVRSTQ